MEARIGTGEYTVKRVRGNTHYLLSRQVFFLWLFSSSYKVKLVVISKLNLRQAFKLKGGLYFMCNNCSNYSGNSCNNNSYQNWSCNNGWGEDRGSNNGRNCRSNSGRDNDRHHGSNCNNNQGGNSNSGNYSNNSNWGNNCPIILRCFPVRCCNRRWF